MNIKEDFYCSRCMRKIEDEGICPFCSYDPAQPVSRRALEEGTLLLNGRYQLGAVLGIGGFGITYAAWDLTLGQAVAVKEYFPQGLADRDVWESNCIVTDEENKTAYILGLQRFSREARILGALQNLKNVVTVFDWFEANNTAYIVMEFVRGQTLDAYVRENKVKPQQLLNMFRELIDGLVLIHDQGVLHRDISPTNIMVEEDGSLKLIDFGASVVEKRRKQGLDQTVMFNRSFAPIEQYEEKGEQGAWTDVYALSATIYYLLTGKLPQESPGRIQRDDLKPLKTYRLGLKRWQEKAIMDGIAVHPDRRIQNMRHFRSVLYHLPLPEEIKRQRKFMLRAGISMTAITALAIAATLNATYGFYLGGGLRYSLRKDGFHVVGYSGSHAKLTIPEKRLGISVVSIDNNAFQGKESFTDVAISETVKEIGEFAFNNCENLSSVTLPEGIKNLGVQAFGNCPGLQAVTIPDSLESMDKNAFAGASDRLVLLGDLDSAAAEMAEKQGIHFAYIETEDSETGITVTKFETRQETANIPDYINGRPVTQIGSGIKKKPVFPNTVYSITLPNTLEKIGDYAFLGVPISEIQVPDTVVSIGDYAFSQTQLEEIYIPDSVIYVGEAAFSVCIKLAKARLSSSLTYIMSGCFEQDTMLTEIELPGGIKEIQMLAFSGCESLESIGIPNGCRIVGSQAFQDCQSLKVIYLPGSLEFMFGSALAGCPNSLVVEGRDGTYAQRFAQDHGYEFYSAVHLDEGTFISPSGSLMIEESAEERDITVMPSYYRGIIVKRVHHAEELKSRKVTLPSQTETISSCSFYKNKYLESIECPNTLKQIRVSVFFGCENLKDVKNLPEGLNEIGIGAFASCSNLEEIHLPDSVNKIGFAAFENCPKITEVKIPASMVKLENDSFANTGIRSIVIPGNIVKCEPAFYGCGQLEDAIIENGVRILLGTFAECRNLRSVVIPDSVERISKSTFLNCQNLEDVWIYSLDTQLNVYSPVTWHINYGGFGDENGEVMYERMPLEEEEGPGYLFSDSPKVTIHGLAGSSAQEYALKHGINFEVIESADFGPKNTADVPNRRSISEDILERVIPFFGQSSDYYWGQLQYALGYGLTDIANDCLDACEAVGDESDGICAESARLFMAQASKPELGYCAGAIIACFEDSEVHPTLKTGDIIVEIDGEQFQDAEGYDTLKEKNQSGIWTYTVLRPDEHSVLHRAVVSVSKEDPAAKARQIMPQTFAEQ